MALSLLMLVTALATSACGEEETDDTLTIEGNAARAMTLSIWGIKGEGTTDEAIAEVEAAMSKLTEAQFNTAIDLVLLEEDEYEKKLEEYMDTIQARIDAEKAEAEARKKAEREAKKRSETLATEETEKPEETSDTADETILDEYGLPTTLYPEVEEDQLDIFLITDYEMLEKFNEKGVFSSLDEQLNGASKLIKSYIHPTMISAGKMNGKTVAIINQQLVGEYTYMLVNKELLEKYYWDIDNIATLSDAYQFILDVEREEPEYQPFVGDISPINVQYFSLDGQKTVFGNMLAPTAVSGDDFTPRFMFQVVNWTRHIKLYKNLDFNNCIGSETFTADDKFGVGIMKGNANDLAAYEEDYHVVILQAPQGTTDNIFNGMFAVSTYTKSVARSMEIITYLNTRSEIRNIFGYGIEGVHYELDDEGRLTRLNDDYNMKLEYTGNCFIAHAPDGQTKEYWDLAKDHNIELVLSPYFKLNITEEDIDMEMYAHCLEIAEDFYADLDECTSEEEVVDLLDEYWELCENDDVAVEWINEAPTLPEDAPEDAEPPKTIGKFYKDWSKIKK